MGSGTAQRRGCGEPGRQQGVILVGFLHLLDGCHAVLQLLQGRVDAGGDIVGPLHEQGVLDQAGEFEVVVVVGVAGSPGGLVEFVSGALGGGLQGEGLVAAFELLGVGQPCSASGAFLRRHLEQGSKK